MRNSLYALQVVFVGGSWLAVGGWWLLCRKLSFRLAAACCALSSRGLGNNCRKIKKATLNYAWAGKECEDREEGALKIAQTK